jgi:hypothetical protein
LRRGAQLAFKGHDKLVSRTIYDMLDSDARISLEAPITAVPQVFMFVLIPNTAQCTCRAAWSKSRFIGAKFVPEWFGTRMHQRPKFAVRDLR